MTMTLGYQVKDLSDIPSKLKGVSIPANEFLVYPIKGDQSDYDSDRWEQWEQALMRRKAESVDFEMYTFGSNYEIEKAALWIATQ